MIINRTVLLGFITSVFLWSCSKGDDSTSSPVQAELNGTWKVTSYYFDGRVSTNFQEDFSYYDYTGTAGQMDLTMIFTTNQNYTFDGYYFLDNTITTDEGDFYAFTDYHTVADDGIWTIENNSIDLIVNGEETNIGISQLTQSQLILRINTNTSVTAANNTTTTDTSKHETFILERLN